MSDKKIQIDINTTANTEGAREITKSISQLEKELKDARNELRNFTGSAAGFEEIKQKIKSTETELKSLQKPVEKLGRGGDAGRAVLEFSRAFEDAQYGIRGVLNNIPGLITMLGGGAGLAGVISVAAVLGTQLWERLGDSKEAEDKIAKFITDNKKLIESIKTAIQTAITEQKKLADDGSLERSFERRRIAIEREKKAMEDNNAILKTGIELRGKLAKLLTEESLRDVDRQFRAGTLTEKEANQKKLDIQLTDAQGDIARQKELRDLEDQKVKDQLENAQKSQRLAVIEKNAADEKLKERLAELESVKRQITLRQQLDQQVEALKELQQKKFAEFIQLENAPGNEASLTNEAAEKAREAATKLYNDIIDLEKEIGRRAPEQVTKITKKNADGSDGETVESPILKRAKILEEGEKKTGVKSLAELTAEVAKLDEKAKEAAVSVDKAADAVGQQQKISQGKDIAAEIDSKNNPVLQEVEKKAGESVKKLMDEILARIPNAANDKQVQKVVKKIENLTADGVQRNEVDESTDLLRQLQAKMSMEDSERAKLYQKIILNSDEARAGLNAASAALDAATAAFGTATMKMQTNAAALDDMRRRIEGLEQNAKR